MEARGLLRLVLCYLAASDAVTGCKVYHKYDECNLYTYELGHKDDPKAYYYAHTVTGNIGESRINNRIDVNLQYRDRGYFVTYVNVHVYALNAPEVSFDESREEVTISYSFYQITTSNYWIDAWSVWRGWKSAAN